MSDDIPTIKLAPDLQICRIINGMWQVAGGHGQINRQSAIREMIRYHDSGFKTWDMADIYGPAEEFLGEFRQKLIPHQLENSQALTKFVPNPGPMTGTIVKHYIEESIRKMNVSSIDVVQFHWWDYNDTSYLDVMHHLSKLQDEGKIRYLGLTNFDTERVHLLVEQGFKLVSHQVQYSVLDQRPNLKMAPFCKKYNIKLLTYGTLLGGFLSERYLGRQEPTRGDLNTYSLQKYKKMIDTWGGWQLFQALLITLDSIAKKHNVSIANVATKFILDMPAVGGVIIGARLGISEHLSDNKKSFGFSLDNTDYAKIKEITSQANNLFESIGDCGDEYR